MIKTLLTLITFSIMLAGCVRPEVTRHTMPVTVTGPVRTAYHDLPADQMRRLRILLDAEDLSALDEESCRILLEHARAALLTGRSPFGPSISANYFWNIYLQLPVFVDPRERHQGYYKDEKRSLPDARLLAYACYRLDRSPENLRRIFSRVQPVLVQTVPREMYVHANAPDYIAGLLYAYRELQNLSGSHARLAEFYESVYTAHGAVRRDAPAEVLERYNNSAYGLSVYDLAELIAEKLKVDRHSGLHGSPALPFWMRRVHEGNAGEVYAILCEIEKMYRQ